MNSPRNRKGERVNPPANANASEFYPNPNSRNKVEGAIETRPQHCSRAITGHSGNDQPARVKQPGNIAGYFGILPDANFCYCFSIQASISLRMPVSAHWSQAFPACQYQP